MIRPTIYAALLCFFCSPYAWTAEAFPQSGSTETQSGLRKTVVAFPSRQWESVLPEECGVDSRKLRLAIEYLESLPVRDARKID